MGKYLPWLPHQVSCLNHKTVHNFLFATFEELGVIRQVYAKVVPRTCTEAVETTLFKKLSYEQHMQLCSLAYQSIHSNILYDDNDGIDEEEMRNELKRLNDFFREIIVLIDFLHKICMDKSERLNALLVDHMGCRSHLQAASVTFRKEGRTAKFFKDFNECGRLVGFLLDNHFASTKEDH